jgi:hypothetical protein
MFGRMQLIVGALAGVVTALVVAVALVVAWPAASPAVPPKPTAVVLASDAPSFGPTVSATPFTTSKPSPTIGAFGDQ